MQLHNGIKYFTKLYNCPHFIVPELSFIPHKLCPWSNVSHASFPPVASVPLSGPTGLDCHSRHLIWVRSHSLCPSVPGSVHVGWCSQGSLYHGRCLNLPPSKGWVLWICMHIFVCPFIHRWTFALRSWLFKHHGAWLLWSSVLPVALVGIWITACLGCGTCHPRPQAPGFGFRPGF